jgi:hypothetical protein
MKRIILVLAVAALLVTSATPAFARVTLTQDPVQQESSGGNSAPCEVTVNGVTETKDEAACLQEAQAVLQMVEEFLGGLFG